MESCSLGASGRLSLSVAFASLRSVPRTKVRYRLMSLSQKFFVFVVVVTVLLLLWSQRERGGSIIGVAVLHVCVEGVGWGGGGNITMCICVVGGRQGVMFGHSPGAH